MELVFEWDPRKQDSNFKKHGLRFSEAISVFSDPLARIFMDEDHSDSERRGIIIGNSTSKRLLLVCFIEQNLGYVRIISARRATAREKHDYEENLTP